MADWGGDRGPSSAKPKPIDATWTTTLETSRESAALYRLTGDRHPVHVDPEVATTMGFERPILHGLATLGMATRALAGAVGAHPADLRTLESRLVGPVLPGQDLLVSAAVAGTGEAAFEVAVGDVVAVTGTAIFA